MITHCIFKKPKALHETMEDAPFFFWTPAFKIRPQDFLRFSLHLTLSQPQGDWIDSLPQGRCHPVTLTATEATESLKINLAAFMKPQRLLLPMLHEVQIRPTSHGLMYIPFEQRGLELFYPRFQLHLNKNLLTYARYL